MQVGFSRADPIRTALGDRPTGPSLKPRRCRECLTRTGWNEWLPEQTFKESAVNILPAETLCHFFEVRAIDAASRTGVESATAFIQTRSCIEKLTILRCDGYNACSYFAVY